MVSREGKVQTVLGCVRPELLGATHTHEHLSMKFGVSFYPPREKFADNVNLPFEMKNLGWIRQYPYSHKENLQLCEEQDAVLEEIKNFKKNGGQTIVENTTNGINRDPLFYKKVALETGVNVICGAGYYVGKSHPSNMGSLTEEQICTEIVSQVNEGFVVDDSGEPVRCGIIGEIGCTYPFTEHEKKSLRSAAQAQSHLGAPLMIHPGRNKDQPAEIVRILQEAGADTRKIVMGHLDRTIHNDDDLLEFAKLGTFCEYDLFGIEISWYQRHNVIAMPSDAERIRRIQLLIKEGYLDKIVMAHDIHTKHRLVKFGGHGYSHILDNVVPQMLAYGVSQQQIDTILISNPARWLTFDK